MNASSLTSAPLDARLWNNSFETQSDGITRHEAGKPSRSLQTPPTRLSHAGNAEHQHQHQHRHEDEDQPQPLPVPRPRQPDVYKRFATSPATNWFSENKYLVGGIVIAFLIVVIVFLVYVTRRRTNNMYGYGMPPTPTFVGVPPQPYGQSGYYMQPSQMP